MNIREFAFNLQKLYGEMSDTFSAYQSSTGLKCLSGCGRCCANPEIEASVLEMIPFALKIYDQGKIDEWLEKLEQTEQKYCLLLSSITETGQGTCSSYEERPSLCRMFGVAGTYDKQHAVTLSICKYIKEASAEIPSATPETPLLSLWNTKLSSLNPELIQKKIPINQAMKEALEKISFYAQFQRI